MKSVEAQSQMLKGAFYFYKWKDLRAAKVFYNEAITTAPESREAELAKEKLAIIDTKMQEVVDMIRDSLVPTSDDEGVVDPTKF